MNLAAEAFNAGGSSKGDSSLAVTLKSRSNFLALVPGALAAVVALVTLGLTFAIFANTHLVQADLSTYLLPARFRSLGFGSLYAGIFDIKPPLAYAMFVPWTAAFGYHLLGFWILYAVLLALVFACFWYLLRRFLNPWYSLFVFASCAGTIVGLGMLEELFFTTEVVCLLLVLSGLALLMRCRSSLWAVFASAVLVTAAGQVKEVFILAPLSLLPLLLSPAANRGRRLVVALLGVLSTLLATLLVLLLWGGGAATGYLEILQFKRERFPAPGLTKVAGNLVDYSGEVVRWLPLLGVFILALIAILFLKRIAPPTFRGTRGWDAQLGSAIALAATVFVGFLWQGAPLVLHYALAVIFPLYILLAALLGWALKRLQPFKKSVRVLVTVVLLLGLLPSISSIAWVYGRTTTFEPGAVLAAAGDLESASDLEVFREIDELATPAECIQAAYGWSASANYLYSDRKSCTRFVVPPLALDGEYREEMQQDLINNPPAVLVLDRDLADQTALPVSEGTPETVIFPFEAVASQCYSSVDGWPMLYVPSAGELSATSECIAEQVRANIKP